MELPPIATMDTVATIFGVLLFFHALFRISGSFSTHRKILPPEAGGAWPLIGHLHLLSGKEPAHKTLANMADAYGPIFTLKLGVNRALVVSSWEIARECLTTHDKTFATRPKLTAGKLLGYDFAMVGFSLYGPHWRHVRKIATLQVLSNHRQELLQHIRISEVRSSMRELYEFWVKSKNNGEDKPLVEMKTWFGDVTLNTIFRMVVGKRFVTAFVGGVGNESYRKAFRDFFELSGVFVVSDSLPFLKWFDLGGHEKAMKMTAKELDEVFDIWLKEHQERRDSGEEKAENDFMDVMLSDVENGAKFSSYDADTAIKATCLGLILAGSDTVTITMIWALSLLLNNQESLERAQRELEEKVGRERQVKETDVKNLLYLQAIVKETLRLYPAGPLSVPHESIEDCTVAGYYIPSGTRLIVNLQKLQRDPLIWKDPCEFRPERFLTSHKDVDIKGQNPELIPFGSGRRMCPGISFALQVMHLTLANLLHGFEISRPSEKPVDMEESIGLTSVKKTPLEVILSPRLSPHVYE